VGSAQQTLVVSAPAPAPVTGVTVPGNGTQPVGPSLSIATKVTAPAGSGVVATARGLVKIQGVRKTIKLAPAVVTLAAAQSGDLNLKPKGSKTAVKAALKVIRAALAKGKKVTAVITVNLVDDAGNTRTVKRTVVLTK
jgi:hypothetical protein